MSVRSSVSPGFVLLVFILLCLLVLKSRVVVSFFFLLVNFSSDDAGRFVLCEFRFHGKSFRVVSLYAPQSQSCKRPIS